MDPPGPTRRRGALAALPALTALLSGCIEFAEAGSNAAGNFFLELILVAILLLLLAAVVVAGLLGVGLYGILGKGKRAKTAAAVATVAGALLVLGSIPGGPGLLVGGALFLLGVAGLQRARAAKVADGRPAPAGTTVRGAPPATVLRRGPRRP